MTSLLRSVKQVPAESKYLVVTGGDFRGKVSVVNPATGVLSTAAWAASYAGAAAVNAAFASSLSAIGSAGVLPIVLRDMGKTVTSAARVFRKVQLVVNATSTFGVGGPAAAATFTDDYLTGYLESFNVQNPGTATTATGYTIARYGL